MRSKTKTKSGISALEKQDGSLTTSDQETAETLNNYFTTVFVNEEIEVIPHMESRQPTTPLTNINITEELVDKAIRKVNPSKSPGPDGLHPKLDVESASEFKIPLTKIFRKSLQEGVIPTQWKWANVSPIFKSGKKPTKQLPTNTPDTSS